MKGRCVIGSPARVTKGRNVSMEVKRGLRNSILLPTLMYGSKTWDMEQDTAVNSAWCGNELSERSMRRDKMGR